MTRPAARAVPPRRESFSFEVPAGGVDCVSALHQEPESAARGSAFLLAHGAGNDMRAEFTERIATGLAERGFGVLRFDYPYQERARREGRRRPPDRRPVLEGAHRAALAALEERAGGRRLILAGKSMGGRIASYLAASGSPCAGLVLLGYPLHPVGRPERVRGEHFAAIAQAALFLQGTRDKLCRLAALYEALERFGGPHEVVEVEGGDHGFAVPKKLGGTGAPDYGLLLDAIDGWVRRSFGD